MPFFFSLQIYTNAANILLSYGFFFTPLSQVFCRLDYPWRFAQGFSYQTARYFADFVSTLFSQSFGCHLKLLKGIVYIYLKPYNAIRKLTHHLKLLVDFHIKIHVVVFHLLIIITSKIRRGMFFLPWGEFSTLKAEKNNY